MKDRARSQIAIDDARRVAGGHSHRPWRCTDDSAIWCPLHGDCTCIADIVVCPLHGVDTNHPYAEELVR